MDQQQLFNAGPVRQTSGSTTLRRPRICRQDGCDRLARAVQGARYCEEHACMVDGRWSADAFKERGAERECLACGRSFKRWRNTRATSFTVDVCPDCIRDSPLTIRRLEAHKVPAELAAEWLRKGPDLRCEFCERRLHRKGQGPQIDHDHRCCPGSESCGKCIRGILCSSCNTGLAGTERILAVVSLEKVLAWIK